MTDQTLGWRTDERIAELHAEADRRRQAAVARPGAKRTGTVARIARHVEARLGRCPDPVVTANA